MHYTVASSEHTYVTGQCRVQWSATNYTDISYLSLSCEVGCTSARVRSSGQPANIVKFRKDYLLLHDYLSLCSITVISSNYYLSLLLPHQANYSLVAKPVTDEYNYSILQINFLFLVRGRNVGQSLFMLHMKEIKAPTRPKQDKQQSWKMLVTFSRTLPGRRSSLQSLEHQSTLSSQMLRAVHFRKMIGAEGYQSSDDHSSGKLQRLGQIKCY